MFYVQYIEFILNPIRWGGQVELNILATRFKVFCILFASDRPQNFFAEFPSWRRLNWR